MISSYRLGDLISGILNPTEQDVLLKDYPDSIGGKYILELRKNKNNFNGINTVTNIVLEHTKNCVEFLPKDISDSTLIHLRLGDVVAGNEWHEKLKRPFEVDYLKNLVSNDTNKKYIIGKCFFALPSSTNYEECVRASNEYLQNVIQELNGEHFDSGNADIDLCCAVKSKVFVQGKGHFSKLIVDIRNQLNLTSITTYDSSTEPLKPIQPPQMRNLQKKVVKKIPPRLKTIIYF